MPSELYSFDAYAPAEIARRVEIAGVTKARMPTVPLLMLGVLAGAFIGLGTMLFVIVRADPGLGFAASQVGSGVVFSLGLVLVTVAGAELFTGNNLLAMAWADGRISSRELLRNWVLVCLGNFAGAAGLAALVYASGHTDMAQGAIGRTVARIAAVKQDLPVHQAFARAVLCNVLVCMAAWMAMAGRGVADKILAVVFPITAFVAAGFEHSIANMYLMPLAMFVQSAGEVTGVGRITFQGMMTNLVVVIAGNLLGGSVLVALTYHLIYRRSDHGLAGAEHRDEPEAGS